jgi:hypothetical protein
LGLKFQRDKTTTEISLIAQLQEGGVDGKRIWLIALIVASFIFGIASVAMTGPSPTFGSFVGRAIGAGFLPALIPLLWLAVIRFDFNRASGPLWAWSILLLIIGGLNAVAIEDERDEMRSHSMCSTGSGWCVAFQGTPTMQNVDMPISGTNNLVANRYEYSNRTTYFRAEFSSDPLFSLLDSHSDEQLRQLGVEFTKTEGLLVPEIYVENDPTLGRILNIRGSKGYDRRIFKVWSKSYYGGSGGLQLTVAEPATIFPSRETNAFFASVTKN